MNIDKAMKIARKKVEKLYTGLCTISEYEKVKNKETKRIELKENIILENKPCRISYNSFNATVIQDDANSVSQSIKLFIAPEVEIKPNSKITVTQNGVTKEYQRTGEPAVYATHQEINLELFEGWA